MTLLVLAARQTGASFHHVWSRIGARGLQSSPSWPQAATVRKYRSRFRIALMLTK